MKKIAARVAAMVLCCQQTAIAGPADYVYTPAVEYGEREIDFKYGHAGKKGEDSLAAASIGFGYGAMQRWFTEIYAKYQKQGAQGMNFDAFEWENKFQLTETGEYPVDVGLIVEIERPRDRAEGYEVRWGPLFQWERNKLQLNANLLFARNYRSDLPNQMEIGYQFQGKYRWTPALEFGFQAFGEMGRWDRWAPANEQNHRIGPAIFGKFPLGGRQAIKYNAAYLVGTTSAAPGRTLRVQAEFEF